VVRRLKPPPGWLLASVVLGAIAAALAYWAWPHANVAVYAIAGLVVGALLYSAYLKFAGYERMAGRD
jgi:hypothetical protein